MKDVLNRTSFNLLEFLVNTQAEPTDPHLLVTIAVQVQQNMRIERMSRR